MIFDFFMNFILQMCFHQGTLDELTSNQKKRTKISANNYNKVKKFSGIIIEFREGNYEVFLD